MKRQYLPLYKALKEARESYGLCACYEIENMWFCKDGVTRWYHFTSVNGIPTYTLKKIGNKPYLLFIL